MLQDIALTRSDGATYPDFGGSLGDADEHDIHNSDAADEHRDTSDRSKNIGKHVEDRRHALHHRHLREDCEVLLPVPAFAQYLCNLGDRVVDAGTGACFGADSEKLVIVKESESRCRWYENEFIDIEAEFASQRSHNADNAEFGLIHSNRPTEWIVVPEEAFSNRIAEYGDPTPVVILFSTKEISLVNSKI